MATKRPVSTGSKFMLNLMLFMFALLALLEILMVTGVLLVEQSFLMGFGAAIVLVFFEAIRLQMDDNRKDDKP